MQSKPRLRIATLLLSTLSFAQSPLPAAPHRHVVSISPPAVHANEPSIAVNPNDPNQVVAAFQPAGIAYSTDGGQTFALADLPPVEGWREGGDVSVTFDNKGTAYLATLHFDKLGSASYWGHGAGRNVGDYTWLTSYNRKVYGVWTEALDSSPADQRNGHPPCAGTVVRVGIADFSGSK